MFWVYLMSKTYEHHEVAKKLVALLKIVLFRGENDTVLTSTNELGSGQNTKGKTAALMHKKAGKGLRFGENQIIKQDPLIKEISSQVFIMKPPKTSQNKRSKNILKNGSIHKELKDCKNDLKVASRDGIDSKCSSVDMIYVVGESSIRGSKDLKNEFGSPSNINKLSPIVNRQAHKVHIVKKLEETQKSIRPKESNRSSFDSLPK